MDGDVVSSDLKDVCQLRGVVVMADPDLAVQGHRRPARDCVAGLDCKANGIYDVRCRQTQDTDTDTDTNNVNVYVKPTSGTEPVIQCNSRGVLFSPQ